MTDAVPTVQHTTVNDLDFAYLDAGTGPLALCLHGFPDTAHGWVPLLGALADAGFHAVAPFMRGYAPTAVAPDGGSPLAAWVADANAWHGAMAGDGDAVLIGHDWGALTTYGAAGFAPDNWSRIVTASIPPTSVMATRLTDYDFLKDFWYQYVFLQPTAEDVVRFDDFRFIERLWGDWSPGYDATEALVHVKDALREPANLTAALHTYRSMYDMGLQPPELLGQMMAVLSPHPQPTLYLHGETDGCVSASVIDETRGVLPDGSRAELIEGAGHFLQYEQPDAVINHIVDFLA